MKVSFLNKVGFYSINQTRHISNCPETNLIKFGYKYFILDSKPKKTIKSKPILNSLD